MENKKAPKELTSGASPHLSETSPSDKHFLINEGDTYTNQDQDKLNKQTRIVNDQNPFVSGNETEKI